MGLIVTIVVAVVFGGYFSGGFVGFVGGGFVDFVGGGGGGFYGFWSRW